MTSRQDKAAARGPRASRQAAPAAGSAAAPLHGGHYTVQPGADGAEYWDATLDGLGRAQERACYLSASGPVQQVLVRRAGRNLKILFEYAAGTCTLHPASVTTARHAAEAS